MIFKWLKIQSYKHDGLLHRYWDRNFLIAENNTYFITVSRKTKVVESDGRVWFSKEPAVAFFSKKNWFNVIAMIKEAGIVYYVNIASPTIYEKRILKYIDYDLDFKLFPDNSIVPFDEKEFQKHTLKYGYSPELIKALEISVKEVAFLMKNRKFPFVDHEVEKYYNLFLSRNERLNKNKE